MSTDTILNDIYRNESTLGSNVYLTQPLGGGQVVEYTWAETMDRARRLAAYLQAQNFPAGSKIGMISKNSAHFFIVELAIWMAGHTTVAMYPTINAETAGYVCEHSDMVMLFVGKLDTWDSIKPGVPDGLPMVAMPQAPPNDYPKLDDLITEHDPIAGKPERNRDDLGIIIYTSGSTGMPKGVMHNFSSITDASRGIVKHLEFTPDDRVLSYLPLAHVFERAYIECTSFVAGQHVFFAESLDTFVQDLKRAHPTLFISVPRLWLKFQLGVFKKMPPGRLNFLLKVPVINNIIRKKLQEGLGLDATRLCGSGSAPIPAELIAWYRSLGLNLMEGYAMSEDFAYSHLSKEGFSEPGYVGVPYPEVQVRLSDADEILIKSPGTMAGYYKLPETNAECFTEDGFFKTGDRGSRKPDGMLKITGRVKEIFKTSKGKYVAPAPIENLLNNDPNIELSCVSGSGQPQPYAQIVLAEDLRPRLGEPGVKEQLLKDLEALRKSVNEQIQHHEHLQLLVVTADEWSTENGMLTPTMKIRRNSIEDATKDRVDGWYESGKSVVFA